MKTLLREVLKSRQELQELRTLVQSNMSNEQHITRPPTLPEDLQLPVKTLPELNELQEKLQDASLQVTLVHDVQ